VDDLRLFKALEQAGLAGRVVVVDTVADADAVLAVRTKRTGKQVSGGSRGPACTQRPAAGPAGPGRERGAPRWGRCCCAGSAPC
jgi:hypothetical protein